MNYNILTQNLGLSDKEAAVYIAVLELGDSTVQPIARRSNIKRTSIYYFIDHLVELGLIEQATIRGRKHFKARSPEYLVSLQKERLKEIEQAVPQFMSLFNISTNKPKISYFEGLEQMRQIMLEELHHKEVRFIWPVREIVEMIGGAPFMERLIKQLKEKKIKVKTLRFPDQEVIYEGHLNEPGDEWREIRYAKPGTNFPMAIGIYDDDTVAFLTSKKEGFGIMIESVELGEAMKFLFELFWAQSQPA